MPCIDVFNHDSPGTIVEAAIDMKKIEFSKIADNQIWQTSSSEKLVEKLNALLSLDFDNFDVIMSAQSEQLSNLTNLKDGQFGNSVNDCLDKRQCKGLRELVEYLGNCH
jgi:hypothetical protein